MASNALVLQDLVYSIEPAFNGVAVDSNVVFQREAEFALQQITKTDYAMKLALANQQSVRDAVTNVAAIGISLNPARKQAYLVPRDKGIHLDISYMGLLDMAVASGSIRWGQAELVRQRDHFKRQGVDKPPIHEFEEFDPGRGPVVGVYVVVKTADGDYLTTSMTIDEVYDVRDRSSAWKAWLEKKKKNPWVTDEGEMIKKTVIKRASKTWPRTERLDKATHYLNTDGGEGMSMADSPAPAQQANDEPHSVDFSSIVRQIREAPNLEAVAELRRKGLTAASRTRDKQAYDNINAAVARRRETLNATDVTHKEVPA